MGRFASHGDSAVPEKPHQTVAIPVGARCEVELVAGTLKKRGTVRFVGPTKFGAEQGDWVGIELDDRVGKNDGSLVLVHFQGVRSC